MVSTRHLARAARNRRAFLARSACLDRTKNPSGSVDATIPIWNTALASACPIPTRSLSVTKPVAIPRRKQSAWTNSRFSRRAEESVASPTFDTQPSVAK
jgi:hypothetical protein